MEFINNVSTHIFLKTQTQHIHSISVQCPRHKHKKFLNHTTKDYELQMFRNFPGGPVLVATCQCRGHGFSSWSGKIPQAVQQLSPRTTTAESTPQLLKPLCPRAHAPQQEKPLLAATRESPHRATKTQHSQK